MTPLALRVSLSRSLHNLGYVVSSGSSQVGRNHLLNLVVVEFRLFCGEV